MSLAVESLSPEIGLVATARYIPPTRMWPECTAQRENANAMTPQEKVMRSVYADTLQWRRTVALPVLLERDATQIKLLSRRPVAIEQHLTLAEMALTAARKIRERSAGPDNPAPDQIIVCATTFEHELALACAGRLHSETGSGNAPFAIGQLQGASFLVALQVARALMASDTRMGTVLIVAAERWRAPFGRVVGTLTALGDGAAAALIGHHRSPGWRVRSITIRTPALPASGTPETVYIDDATIVDVIRETCMTAGLKPSAIDWILPARINPVLAREISTRAGLLPGRIPYTEADSTGYLCSADTPACLDALLRAATPSHGQHILLWSAGFQGQAACAILEFRGK